MDSTNQPPGRGSESRFYSVSTKMLKASLTAVIFVLGVVGVAAVLNAFVFQSYYVAGRSMTPTLQNYDRLVVSKVERTIAEVQHQNYVPERGQIVVLDQSVSTLTNIGHEELIKRVIGLPGDRVVVRNDGRVVIYNAEHPSGYDVDKSLGLALGPTVAESADSSYDVGPGQIFVMGDNRGPGGSYDSRTFGPVDSDKIVGRLLLRILPFDKAEVF